MSNRSSTAAPSKTCTLFHTLPTFDLSACLCNNLPAHNLCDNLPKLDLSARLCDKIPTFELSACLCDNLPNINLCDNKRALKLCIVMPPTSANFSSNSLNYDFMYVSVIFTMIYTIYITMKYLL